MEVDNADSFIDNESDNTDVDVDVKTSTKFTKHYGESSTIRISPIANKIGESEIYEFLKPVVSAKPLSITIVSFFAVRKKGVTQCYVVCASKKDACAAADKLNKKKLGELTVEVIVTANSKQSSHELKGLTNWVKLAQLAKDVTEQDILTHIQAHGGIANKPKNILLMHHPKNDDFLGYALVKCADNNDATKCVNNLCSTELKGQKIWCMLRPIRKPMPRNSGLAGKTTKVVLFNLHTSLKESDVEKLCAKFGVVKEAFVWFDNFGYPVAAATITMSNEDEATALFEGMNGQIVKHLKIRTSYTDRKGKSKNKNKTKDLKKDLVRNKNITKKLSTGGQRDGVGGNKSPGNTERAMNKKFGRGGGRKIV